LALLELPHSRGRWLLCRRPSSGGSHRQAAAIVPRFCWHCSARHTLWFTRDAWRKKRTVDHLRPEERPGDPIRVLLRRALSRKRLEFPPTMHCVRDRENERRAKLPRAEGWGYRSAGSFPGGKGKYRKGLQTENETHMKNIDQRGGGQPAPAGQQRDGPCTASPPSDADDPGIP